MRTTIYCPDIECESCVKIITKALNGIGVTKLQFTNNSVDVDYEPQKASLDLIISVIQSKGFRAGTEPFTQKTFGERFRDFRSNKHKYLVERKMIGYSFFAFVLLLVAHALAYDALFKTTAGFLGQFGWWLFYIDVAVVSIGAAMWHIRAYRPQVTMMVGMMIGMTFGMQTGMMLGTIIGATNGLFVGSLAGMLIAVLVGVFNGRCCGVMGVLEGAMAGLMGGIMGGMTGMMLGVDNILWLMPFFFAINAAIMWGLSYMLYEEAVEDKKVTPQPMPFLTFFSYCVIASGLLTALIIYGPKTGIAALGVIP